jgi:hypothetical protein
MIIFPRAKNDYITKWCIVTLPSGRVASVALDDLVSLALDYEGASIEVVSLEEAESINTKALRDAYMSANCRIKAGESGGVG